MYDLYPAPTFYTKTLNNSLVKQASFLQIKCYWSVFASTLEMESLANLEINIL
jgi:hypothetical protein